MIDRIKRFFAENFNSYSTAEPINDLGDCKRVKKWIKRAKKLFKRYAIVASIIAFLIPRNTMDSVSPKRTGKILCLNLRERVEAW